MVDSPLHRVAVVVIGAGQAGLAAGYLLHRNSVPFVILDGAMRVGDSWRQRWDSLRLFTPARYSALPGLAFPAPPESYPGKDEIADYLESYAAKFDLPVRLSEPVLKLSRCGDDYHLETPRGRYLAEQVIVATGAYQRPYIPPISQDIAHHVTQLHSSAYRNPRQIPDGTVVVVGGANSGAQIAAELSNTHRVWLSVASRLHSLPLRMLGQSLHWWLERTGFMRAGSDSLRGRLVRADDVLVGTSLRHLRQRRGVHVAGRALAARGARITFEDGRDVAVEAVVWATGFRSGYEWIDVPVIDSNGRPVHHGGVTASPGLYFLGLKFQTSIGSALIGWVHHDAQYLVTRITSPAEIGSVAVPALPASNEKQNPGEQDYKDAEHE